MVSVPLRPCLSGADPSGGAAAASRSDAPPLAGAAGSAAAADPDAGPDPTGAGGPEARSAAAGGGGDGGGGGSGPGDGPPRRAEASEHAGRSPGNSPSSPDPPVARPPGSGEEQLGVREEEDFQSLRASLGPDSPDAVRALVRRVEAGFAAESLQHVMGLTRDGDAVDPELEKELRSELAAAGVSVDAVNLRYETLSQEERREFTTFEVQQAFLRTLDHIADLTAKASSRLGHRLRTFDGQTKEQLRVVAGIRVLVEHEQGVVESLLAGFRERIAAQLADGDRLLARAREAIDAQGEQAAGVVKQGVDGVESVLAEVRKLAEDERQKVQVLFDQRPEKLAREAGETLDDYIGKVRGALDDFGGHLRSFENRVQQMSSRAENVGSVVTHVHDEAEQVIAALRQIAGSGLAVKRLALVGSLIGAGLGGFFALVFMLLLWALTAG